MWSGLSSVQPPANASKSAVILTLSPSIMVSLPLWVCLGAHRGPHRARTIFGGLAARAARVARVAPRRLRESRNYFLLYGSSTVGPAGGGGGSVLVLVLVAGRGFGARASWATVLPSRSVDSD